VTTGRMEAFSDGVLAIVITIMVLELRIPDGGGISALAAALPNFLMYVLSFIFIGIYWSNHHHLLQATDRVNGAVLWANLHLLFWLSLVPVVMGWMAAHYREALPTAVYGIVLLLAGIAYYVLQNVIVAAQGPSSRLRSALGHDLKGKVSPLLYVVAILLAFVSTAFADAVYVLVALIWLVPDRRIEVAIDN
jgi:TMEM175 potassium channel family protein